MITSKIAPNVDVNAQFVGEDGILICGECMHKILFPRFGWDIRWTQKQIRSLAARLGYEAMPKSTDDFCSDCDRDFS